MGVKIYTANTVEPLTLAVVRAHLGITPYTVDSNGDGDHPHDEMAMAMLGAAREWAEQFTGRSVALKTYELLLDEFPDDELALPNPPVVSVTSVEYLDSDGAWQAVDASNYALDNGQQGEAWLKPAIGVTWPVTTAMNSVRIRYLAGYQDPEPDSSAPDAEPLPYALRAAMLLMVGHLYANREAVAERQVFEVPLAVESLLRPLRVRLGMA